jgi:hypothetical protein
MSEFSGRRLGCVEGNLKKSGAGLLVVLGRLG